MRYERIHERDNEMAHLTMHPSRILVIDRINFRTNSPIDIYA